jgi:toxin ParE1/3/4
VANVVYAPEADDDLESIVDYIARDKPTAAREWLAQIRTTCETLATQPAMGEEVLDSAFRVAVHSV